MDPAKGSVHPWLKRHISRSPGALCKDCVLVGPTGWIRVIVMCHWPHGGRHPNVCFRRGVTLFGYTHSVTSYRGAQELSAGTVSSEGLCAGVELLWGLDASSGFLPCSDSEKAPMGLLLGQ